MKSEFLSDLQTRKIKEAASGGRARWRLLSPLIYRSAMLDRLVVVHAGYVTDYASVPRLPLAYLLAGDTAHAAAVVHDRLCSIDYPAGAITWAVAADVFREAMEVEGVPAWRRWMMYWAVRLAAPGNKSE